jgi:predicted DsbA family dithiol-disulfide isomerase
MDRLRQVAEELNLPWGERRKTYNSRRAQELGKWAETKGKGDEFHNAVFRAYFANGENIAQYDVLIRLAKTLSLPEKEAMDVLMMGTFKDAVNADWSLAYAMGISAVPTFVLNGRSLVGAQPYEALEQFVKTTASGKGCAA